MIASGVVERIRDMLAAGELSQRKIAQRAGVSRGTVNAIARGIRPDRPAPRKPAATEFVPPSGAPVRCAECGGMVQMPCLLCQVRTMQRRRRLAEMQKT